MDDPSLNTSLARGHEPAETDLRPVGLNGCGLFGLIVASLLLVAGIMRVFGAESGVVQSPTNAHRADKTTSAEPSIDVDQAVELKQLIRQQREMLQRLQWIDQTAGVARIPIEDAIALIAKRGLAVHFDEAPAEARPTP